MKAQTVFGVARELVGTDPQDVHPEYARAVVEMCAELLGLDKEDDTRAVIARSIGLEAADLPDLGTRLPPSDERFSVRLAKTDSGYDGTFNELVRVALKGAMDVQLDSPGEHLCPARVTLHDGTAHTGDVNGVEHDDVIINDHRIDFDEIAIVEI